MAQSLDLDELMDPFAGQNLSPSLGLSGSVSPARNVGASPANPLHTERGVLEDMSWLEKIGHVLSSAAAGASGDLGYMLRLREVQRRKKQHDEELELRKMSALPEMLKAMRDTADVLEGPEQAPEAQGKLQQAA